jgi:hypothetical protein
MNNVAWSGLADAKYYELIAKYCIPSWSKLPGDKYIVHDDNIINIPRFNIVQWNDIYNQGNLFTEFCNRTKPVNFWRKMQSQVWALRNLRQYEYVVLLDTDVEIVKFNQEEFDEILNGLVQSKHIWATGESQLKKLDAGHIIVNMNDPRLDQLLYDYENIWESKKILELDRAYDGEAVESLFEKYPSYKIKNTDHGGGLHTYTLGTVHYGSKIPKKIRSLWTGSTEDMILEMIKNKEVLLKILKKQ